MKAVETLQVEILNTSLTEREALFLQDRRSRPSGRRRPRGPRRARPRPVRGRCARVEDEVRSVVRRVGC